MSDNVLKKDFKKKDVERLRNLITGKHDNKTSIGIGYTKAEEFHKEGDIWEEDNRTWTIKGGIKQNITKLDKAKNTVTLPLFCPSCSKLMKPRIDKLFYIQYNRCFNCQSEFETKLKIEGKWDEYEKNIVNSDIDNTIKDFEVWFDETINTGNNSYITEAGELEIWHGSVKNKLIEEKEKAINFLQNLKK